MTEFLCSCSSRNSKPCQLIYEFLHATVYKKVYIMKPHDCIDISTRICQKKNATEICLDGTTQSSLLDFSKSEIRSDTFLWRCQRTLASLAWSAQQGFYTRAIYTSTDISNHSLNFELKILHTITIWNIIIWQISYIHTISSSLAIYMQRN